MLLLLAKPIFCQNLPMDPKLASAPSSSDSLSDIATQSLQDPPILLPGDSVEHGSDSSALPIPDPARIQGDSGRILTLDSALSILLSGNHDLRQSCDRWLASREAAAGSWGDFEPKLVGRYNHQQTTLPGPLSELKDEYRLGLQGTLPSATQYDFGMRHTGYLYSSTVSDIFFGISLRQPLLRSAWFGAPLAGIETARHEERKAYHEYRSQLVEAVSKLHAAFWECISSMLLLHFEDESVRVAHDLQRDGIRRITTGKISPLDLEKISSELAIRLSRKIEAQRSLAEAREKLEQMLSAPGAPWREPIRLKLPADLHLDPQALKQTSAPNDSFQIWNPERLAQKSDIERQRVVVNGHRSAQLPSIDLLGSYGLYASGKTGAIALNEFNRSHQIQISAGVEVEFPIAGNIKERHQVQSERLGLRAAETRLSQIDQKCASDEDLLQIQVRQLLEQSWQERKAVIYHQRELQAEFRKLAAGKSNYHLLYDIEEKLRDSQKRLIDIFRSYQIARIELQKSRGTLLRDNGLEQLVEGQPQLTAKLISSTTQH